MPVLQIDHEKCTECRMCYVACEEIGINAVYIDLEPRHRFEIDDKCTYPGCVVCLMYCPADPPANGLMFMLTRPCGRWSAVGGVYSTK
jgi:MinD superfamily P-loop ATPase